MPDLHTLVLFGLASLALLVVPGPAVFYIVTRSITEGRRAGAVSMLGIEAGGLAHVAAAALGVSAVLAASAAAFTAVKYVGAAYLVYLGVRKLLERPAHMELPPVGTSWARLFWQGALVQVLNPKTAMFFLAFLPQFVVPARGAVALQVVVLGLCFTGLALLSDGLYVLAAGAAGNWLGARAVFRRRLARLSGGVYVGLGVALAVSGSRPATSEG